MSARKTPARKVKAKLMWASPTEMAEMRFGVFYCSENKALNKDVRIAVLPVDDEEALIEQVAKTLNTEMGHYEWQDQTTSFQNQIKEMARNLLLSLGILKAKRKTRKDAR